MITENDLQRYGKWLERNRDYADEYGENVLYRAALFGGRSDTGPDSGHKIICPEMPRSLREVHIAIRRLPVRHRSVIEAWYSAPVKSDGNLYEARDIARLFGISCFELNRFLREARQMLKKV